MLRIQQLAGLNGLFLVFIRVERRDTLLGGAVLLVLQPRLLQRVQLPMPRQQQRRTVADQQVFRRDADASRADGLHLRHQILTVQRHTVAQNVHHTGAEDAGGQQVQGKFAHIVDDGVSGVAASLIPHHHIVLSRQVVHHPAFSFVTPVDAYDRTICHVCIPSCSACFRVFFDTFFQTTVHYTHRGRVREVWILYVMYKRR